MEYTFYNNRIKKTGNAIIIKYKDIKIGDFVNTGRKDKDNLLPVFLWLNTKETGVLTIL